MQSLSNAYDSNYTLGPVSAFVPSSQRGPAVQSKISFKKLPNNQLTTSGSKKIEASNSEKSFNYIEEYLSLKSQRNKDYTAASKVF